MNNQDYDTGISSEVFTIKSKTRLIDIFNSILDKKAGAVLDLFNSLVNDETIAYDSPIVIIGTYFTGIAIAKYLSYNGFKDITIVDIYPHLEGFINSKLGNPIDLKEDYDFKLNIKFSSDLESIGNGDIVIDTTGLGGINESQSESISSDVFLIEDSIAEDNDSLLKEKNNIYDRLGLVNSNHKFVLKSQGLNTKTSGTMTFTIDILRQSMNQILSKEGVLYCSAEMTFYEEIIFKERDLDKFLSMIETPVIKVSTIHPFECDEVIEGFIDKIGVEILFM